VEGGFATVKLENGTLCRALAVSCGDVGARTQLSIRPERVEVGGKAGENLVEAKVLELIYHGDHIRCRMEVHGNPNFIVKVPNDARLDSLKIDDRTPIGWAAKDCRALDAA
jgi:putative spermidine/putrescine transport system ATP-binding protein